MNEIDIQTQVVAALTAKDSGASRTIQSREGRLGPSDIGFCRNKAVLVSKGVQPTDNPPKWAAACGTALHTYIEDALSTSLGWLVGSHGKIRTTATLPSGAVISGTPDIVAPEMNMVLDIKTVNGFAWTRKQGPSLSHRYQRHLYAMGLVQGGVLDGTSPVLVGNVYFDRSGVEPEPLVFITGMEDELTDEIDSWVTDVIYAVKNDEDSSRDIAPAICERICDFFTVCRGGLESREEDIIEDDYLIKVVEMYVEGKQLETTGKKLRSDATAKLSGVNGVTPTHQVRWVHVNASEYRDSHNRLDVRARR
jgi:hypothetical protein